MFQAEIAAGWPSFSVDRLACPRNAHRRDAREAARRCVARADLAYDAGRGLATPCRSDSSDHLPDSSIDCHTSTWAAPRNRQVRLWRHTRRADSRRSQPWECIPGWLQASRSSRLRTQTFEAFLSGCLGSFVPSVAVSRMLAKPLCKPGALVRSEHGTHCLDKMRQMSRAPAS
jgi:hypothetical protein